MKEEILRLQNIEKSYYGFKALENINLILFKGDILGIVGGNGAGKSTLANILSGNIRYDRGNIYVGEKIARIHSIADAQKHGIVCIYQECCLVDELSVAENIFILRTDKPRWINAENVYQKAQEYLDFFELPVSAHTRVGNLSLSDRRKVEFIKAMSFQAKIVILDELGSLMNQEDKFWLRRQISRMKKSGISFIIISHDLDEVVKISDYTMVMRDGCVVRVLNGRQNQLRYIMQSMLNEENNGLHSKEKHQDSKERLRLENISTGSYQNIDLTVHGGEIVGVYSISEKLSTECSNILYGLQKAVSGSIYIDGKNVSLLSVRSAVKNGIALITGKHGEPSLLNGFSVGENISFSTLSKTSRFGFRNRRFEAVLEKENMEAVNFDEGDRTKLIDQLSGGQKQKVLFAKSIARNCKIYVINNAMANVDFFTRITLYNKLFELRSEKKAILFFSQDYEEIKMISDRIFVGTENGIEEKAYI